jgi:hypothetical protein
MTTEQFAKLSVILIKVEALQKAVKSDWERERLNAAKVELLRLWTVVNKAI